MARPESDIDPRKLDAVPTRRRRRKDRAKPEPKASLKAGKDAAVSRAMARPLAPGVMLEPCGEGWRAASPHSDPDLWELQLADAFGTRSQSVMRTFLLDLRALCREAWDDDLKRWKASEDDLNAALAMVSDWQPENTAQAALAAQAVAVHWMAIRLSSQALNRGGMIMERDAALAGKLSRTYAQLCETMQALKGQRQPIRQTFTVEKTLKQEVHYYDQRGGGADDSSGQPHERSEPKTARIIDQRDPLRGEDEGGVVVPLSRPSGAK
jgi:hypothetical protein